MMKRSTVSRVQNGLGSLQSLDKHNKTCQNVESAMLVAYAYAFWF